MVLTNKLQMANLKNYLTLSTYIIFLIFFISCQEQELRREGVYSRNNGVDILTIYNNGYYKRVLGNWQYTEKWYKSGSDILLNKWVNKGELPIKTDTITPIFNCRYTMAGRCYEITFKEDEDGVYQFVSDN